MKTEPNKELYGNYNPVYHILFTMGVMVVFYLLVFLALIAIGIIVDELYFWFVVFALWYIHPCISSTILTTSAIIFYFYFRVKDSNKPMGGLLLFLFSFLMSFALGAYSFYSYMGSSTTGGFDYAEFIKSNFPIALYSVILAFAQVVYFSRLLHRNEEPKETP